MKKRIISLIVCGMLLIPTQIEARSFSSGCRSSSRPSMSRTSSVSKSSFKSSSIKPGKSMFKSKTNKIPRVNKKVKTNTKRVDLTKTTIKADSGSFKSKPINKTKVDKSYKVKVKPKTSHKKNKSYKPSYYKHYDNRVVYHNSNNSFFEYYMISEMFDDDDEVTQSDIARELEYRGYSNSEIDTILKDDRIKEKDNGGFILFGLVVISGVVIYCIYKKKRK